LPSDEYLAQNLPPSDQTAERAELKRQFRDEIRASRGDTFRSSVEPTEARNVVAPETVIGGPERPRCPLDPRGAASLTPGGSREDRARPCRPLTHSGLGPKSLRSRYP
jgi:hypothetical protein